MVKHFTNRRNQPNWLHSATYKNKSSYKDRCDWKSDMKNNTETQQNYFLAKSHHFQDKQPEVVGNKDVEKVE